jgi:hypothetical protein
MPYAVESGVPHPPGDTFVDWEEIRTLWEAGASLGWIARRHPVNARTIAKKSAEWDMRKREEALAVRRPNASAPPGRPDLPAIGREGRVSSVHSWVETISEIEDPKWDERSFPLTDVAEALHNIASGMPVTLAAEAAGMTDRVLQKYRNAEPRLETLFRKARALSAAPLVKKIMEDRDWRAAAWLLERGIAKAEFKQEAVGKDDKLTIEIMVSRDDKDALAGVIDVTESANATMVAGLPAIREAEDLPRGKG